ncbi:metallophosphoesterase [bacterium]|nr:metallophosphoesterase [bacterium]
MKIVLLLASLLLISCSLPDFEAVKKRVDDSLSGLVAAPGDLDPAGTNNFSFSVFGDAHVGSPFGNNLGEAIANSKSLGDSFSIVAGDLTDYSKVSQFEEFNNLFTNHSMEYRAVIGNHDIYFDGWSNFKKQCWAIGILF